MSRKINNHSQLYIMKNEIKVALLVLGLFFSINSIAQEEFFGNHSGLTGSFSKDLNADISGGGLSLYCKSGLILSGSFDKYSDNDNEMLSGSLGYLVFDHTDGINGAKGLFAVSYGSLLNTNINAVGVTMGVILVFFPASDFPFSIGGSSSVSMYMGTLLYNETSVGASIGYSQSFFAKSPVYPVIGITKSLKISNSSDDLFFHIGLNVRL